LTIEVRHDAFARDNLYCGGTIIASKKEIDGHFVRAQAPIDHTTLVTARLVPSEIFSTALFAFVFEFHCWFPWLVWFG
jgi:hypothetical protein